MAEPQGSVELSTGFGTLKLGGGNALFFFLLLMMGLLIALTFYQHWERHEEHERILCASKLGIYIYTSPKGTPVDWDRLPTDIYPCLPQFLFERPPR